MEKFSYINYAWEIFTVAEKLPTNVNEAWDRFRADVASGEAHDYNTAGLLPEFDFAAAGAAWNALTDGEQQAARDEWYTISNNRNKVVELVMLYRAGDREGFEKALRA